MKLVAFTPDGRMAITGDFEGGVTTWDLRKAEAVETLAGHRREVAGSRSAATARRSTAPASIKESSPGTSPATAGSADRFSAGSGIAANYPRYAMSADGRLLAFGQDNGTVSIVDARTLARRGEIPVGERSAA